MINRTLAGDFLRRWEEMCNMDNGKLWGINLHTPFAFIGGDRSVAANQADNEGLLSKHGDVYVGQFPADKAFSATALTFGGKRWGVAPWGMVDKMDGPPYGLMFHEAFHCIQPRLMGEMCSGAYSGHLDSTEASILILLEISALMHFLRSNDKPALIAALSARNKRERDFGRVVNEVLEGTAVFTEIKLGYAPEEHLEELDKKVASAGKSPHLAHFAGYLLGGLHCFAIDAVDEDARRSIKADADLGAILTKALDKGIPNFDDVDFEPYGHSQIMEEQNQKAADHEEMLRQIREKFIEKPTLSIPFAGSGSINGQIIPVDGLGAVLRGNYEFFCEAGKIAVGGGDVLKSQEDLRKLSAACMVEDGNKITGKNWELTLAQGYAIVADGINFVVAKGENV
ncbi:MAG: hypothetical protein FWE21_06630 [Defluviitaleaceae bacterium]|nr:hypothetical protein [Defluviitaleaceae bacterium]